MKIAFICLLSIFIYSCEEGKESTLKPDLSKEEKGTSNKLKWDNIYNLAMDNESDIYIGIRYSTLQNIAVDNDPLIYVGGVYPRETFADNFDKEITDAIKPVGITFNFPVPFMREKSKRGRISYLKILKEAIHSKEYESYMKKRRKTLHRIRIAEMESYKDIEVVFGDNSSLGESIKNIVSQRYGKNHHNLIIGEIIFKSFSVSMESPINGFFKINRRNYESDNPVYISSITYGSVGYFIIESRYSYLEMLDVFKHMFDGVWSEDILKKSRLTLFTVSDISRQAHSYKSFEDLKTYLNNPFYSDYYYGFPIYCTGNYTRDNAFFIMD